MVCEWSERPSYQFEATHTHNDVVIRRCGKQSKQFFCRQKDDGITRKGAQVEKGENLIKVWNGEMEIMTHGERQRKQFSNIKNHRRLVPKGANRFPAALSRFVIQICCMF